jgi:hypothetical protein
MGFGDVDTLIVAHLLRLVRLQRSFGIGKALSPGHH